MIPIIDFTLIGMIKSGYTVEEAGLTGTVGSDDRVDLPVENLGVHAGEGDHLAKIDMYVFKLKQNV